MLGRLGFDLAALSLASLLTGAQAPAPSATEPVVHRVDRTQLIADVRELSSDQYQGRRTGTPGGLKARAWIRDAFPAIGLKPAGSNGFAEPFALPTRRVDPFLDRCQRLIFSAGATAGVRQSGNIERHHHPCSGRPIGLESCASIRKAESSLAATGKRPAAINCSQRFPERQSDGIGVGNTNVCGTQRFVGLIRHKANYRPHS